MALTLTSPAFDDNGFLPVQYTCDGDNMSPPLAWSEVPEGTAELVLLFEDPDAPGGTQVYWALFGLHPASGGLEEGKVPAGALGGKNDYGRTDWAGPCPRSAGPTASSSPCSPCRSPAAWPRGPALAMTCRMPSRARCWPRPNSPASTPASADWSAPARGTLPCTHVLDLVIDFLRGRGPGAAAVVEHPGRHTARVGWTVGGPD